LFDKSRNTMNLTRTKFTETEAKKIDGINSFSEMGITINMLMDKDSFTKIPSGNHYKFGVYSDIGYHWFFYGKPVANSREKMREIFYAIQNSIKDSIDIPFVYKVKRK
jgi:hypothetical protein